MFDHVRPRARRAAAALIVAASTAGLAGCATDATGLGLNLVPEQQVQQMGLQTWQQIRQQEPVSPNGAYQRTAERISNRVLQAAGRDPSQWEVVVFQGEQANAFALPGGKIGVYEGMIELAANEAQLAAVIAHEIAHNEENHAAERVNSQMATQLGVDLAGAALGQTVGGGGAQIAALLGAGAQYGLLLPYSRNQELEADRQGLVYMARAGYDPREAVELWRRMEAQGGARPPVFASTHPAEGQRIEQLQQLMPQALEVYRQAGGA